MIEQNEHIRAAMQILDENAAPHLSHPDRAMQEASAYALVGIAEELRALRGLLIKMGPMR